MSKALDRFALQTDLPVTAVLSQLDRSDPSGVIRVHSEARTSAARSGLAFLCAFYGGNFHRFRVWLRLGRTEILRIEVHGHASRMNKLVVVVARDGTVLLQGEEIESVVLVPRDGGFDVEMVFRAYCSLVEWLYLFSEEIDGRAEPDFSCASASLQALPDDAAMRVRRHRNVALFDGASAICQSFTVLNNNFSLTFELFKPGSSLAGLRISSALDLAFLRWWTWDHTSLSPREGELVAVKPPHPIRSPGLMDAFGTVFCNQGHTISGIFADLHDVSRMGEAEASRLSRMTLHARFQCGSIIDLPLDGAFCAPDPATSSIPVLENFLSQAATTTSGPLTFLEVGARGQSSAGIRLMVRSPWRYVGVDFMPDPNVDIVGDAHELSHHVAHGSVDIIYSSEVMEHLLSPLRFVLEANRVLKVGGVFIARMPTIWPLHAEPWDFWRISAHGWTSMLNANTGFQILDRHEIGHASVVPHLPMTGMMTMSSAPAPLLTLVIARKVQDVKADTTGWSPDLAFGSYDHA